MKFSLVYFYNLMRIRIISFRQNLFS